MPLLPLHLCSKTDWAAQYDMLPEAQGAAAEAAAGRPDAAVPLLKRALEICSGAMTLHHPLAHHAQLKLAAGHSALGEFGEAVPLLEQLSASVEQSGGSAALSAATLARAVSACHLRLGDTDAAEAAGWKAYHISEAEDPATTDVEALGAALHCVGLAQLISRQEDATDHLQQATRMLTDAPISANRRAFVNFGAAQFWLPSDPVAAAEATEGSGKDGGLHPLLQVVDARHMASRQVSSCS